MGSNPLTVYSFERGEDFHSLGAEVDQHVTFDVGDELIISATLIFGDGRCVLGVWEVVQEVDGRAHRRKYGYQVICGDLVFRYDRDPIHAEMPEHKHLPDGRRVRWEAVTLREVVDEILDLISQQEDDEPDLSND